MISRAEDNASGRASQSVHLQRSRDAIVQPRIQLLSPDLVQRILGEAFQLMLDPGIKVLSDRARDLLQAGGAQASTSFRDRPDPRGRGPALPWKQHRSASSCMTALGRAL